MPSLLSGSKLRTGGSGEFIKLQNAMPQLPQSPSTSTGYTVVTNDKLVTTYASSLGNIEFSGGQVYSNINTQTLTLIGTGTTAVVIRANNPISSTSTLIVQGGVGINGDLFVGGNFEASTSSFLTLKVNSTLTSTDPFSGAFQVVGGAGIGENLNVFGKLSVLSTATLNTDAFVNKTLTVANTATFNSNVIVNGNLDVVNTTTSKNLLVLSTATFNSNVNVVDSVNITGELNVTGNDAVNLSPSAASVNIQPSIGGSVLIQPSLTGTMDNMIIGQSNAQDGYFQTVHAGDLTVTNTAWVGGSVYSQDGIGDYSNLLYTPKVTISTTPPASPRIGDFWIDPTYGVECQYINDGGNFIWVQFTGF